MPGSWKFKATLLVVAVLLAIYTLTPTFLGLKEQAFELNKQGQELPWYHAVLPNQELNLGLDLRGGLYLELEVGVEEALQQQVEFLAGDIKRFVFEDEFTDADVTALSQDLLRVQVATKDQGSFKSNLVRYFGNATVSIASEPSEVFFEVKGDPDDMRKQVLTAHPEWTSRLRFSHQKKYLAVFADGYNEREDIKAAMGLSFVQPDDVLYVVISDEHLQSLKREIIERAANSVRNRIDRYGVAEASVSRQSSDRLVVELPGVKDPDSVIDIIKRTGKLEFRLVSDGLSDGELRALVNQKVSSLKLNMPYQKDQLAQLNTSLTTELPEGTEVQFELNREAQTGKVLSYNPYLLEKRAEVTGDMLENASVQVQTNMPYVSMSFNKNGAKAFGDLTSENVGHSLAIVLDGVVMSAPRIKSAITGGEAQIELGYGRYDVLQKEASDLVLILKEGALPASLSVGTKSLIGPSLGKASIEVGTQSLMIAALAILIFMFLYYRVGGVVANVALLVNVLFMFAILCLFQASLTLPGIAGIVLTLGMAVDANVIIFERMREERFLGKSPAAIVASGYSHAMSAIFDSNITTFIAGLVLFEFGTGPIKGFATTLMIGIVTTLITALVLTRVIQDWIVHGLKVKTVSI